ncbi:MAG: hypothetical protein LQ352_004368 [Teloschistes flavicans]|nr:MAG: hypothetical protein LQ352_004368 [Teloschistes flavicans]
MELARSFTRRNKRSEPALLSPTRATSIRKRDGHVDHSLISSPIELLSTTNVLALNAPDLHTAISQNSPFSCGSSAADESDVSLTFSASSRSSSPDTTSLESGPSPIEPNHLTSYFEKPGRPFSEQSTEILSIPAIPSRAKSHTKKSHQAAALERSNSRKAQPPVAIHSPVLPARSSIDMFSSNPEADHPFGAELAQVDELAEEIVANEATMLDEEERYMLNNSLCTFTAGDYMDEIQGYFAASAYGNPLNPFTTSWF